MQRISVPVIVAALLLVSACTHKHAAPKKSIDKAPAAAQLDKTDSGGPLAISPSKMLPDKSGPFTAGPLVVGSQFVRREYSHGTTKISVTIAEPGITPMKYEEWVKMSGASPAVKLDVPANFGAGFYDCDGAGPKAFCNVHIHLRSGYHVELMGAGQAHRADFDALLQGLPLRALATSAL